MSVAAETSSVFSLRTLCLRAVASSRVVMEKMNPGDLPLELEEEVAETKEMLQYCPLISSMSKNEIQNIKVDYRGFDSDLTREAFRCPFNIFTMVMKAIDFRGVNFYFCSTYSKEENLRDFYHHRPQDFCALEMI